MFVCLGTVVVPINCPDSLSSELFDYYNEGGLDTIEEIELALLLRDQEQLSNEVRFMWIWNFFSIIESAFAIKKIITDL